MSAVRAVSMTVVGWPGRAEEPKRVDESMHFLLGQNRQVTRNLRIIWAMKSGKLFLEEFFSIMFGRILMQI